MRYLISLVLCLLCLSSHAEENYPYTVQCPNKQYQQVLRSVKIAYGRPSDAVILTTGSLHEHHHGVEEHFSIPAADRVWAICLYGDDDGTALSKSLPSSVRECVVTYSPYIKNQQRVLEVKHIACK